MFKTNYMNYGEISHSRVMENKKRNHLYKALTEVESLYNLFKVMLSLMFIALTLVSFVGICCGVVMLILSAPIAVDTFWLSIIAFTITAFTTCRWLKGING